MNMRESVTYYFAQMMTIINNMWILNDKIEDIIIIEKTLQSLMLKFNFVVCSIEESKVIDELQSSLLIHE
jgi:hypothetical protein